MDPLLNWATVRLETLRLEILTKESPHGFPFGALFTQATWLVSHRDVPQ